MRIIAGEKRGGKLFEVDSNSTRSTTDKVKEAIFNKIGPFFHGEVAADFFAGSGSLCIEALSRGCSFAYFFDVGALQVDVIKSNVKKFEYNSKAKVVQCDYTKVSKHLDKKIDLLFLDPPYGYDYVSKCLKLVLENKMLNSNAIVVCEIENKESISYEGFQLVSEKVYGRIKIIVLELV